ncbi:MAG: hypothetical protein HY885_14785 [Deltaproteobacteria bacterium]|nr:hypothetical protein [Deltaproteobacteria bacterium]
MTENITFRNHLFGSVHDFATECGMEPLVQSSTLVELIVALSRYTEEGIHLAPEMYLCENLSVMLKFLPGHSSIHLGGASNDTDGIMKALKKAAPLAIGDWKIYIEMSNGQFEYGLFHGDLSPLSVEVGQTLLSGDDGSAKVVRVHQTGGDCVEIRNYLGKKHNIYLSHKKAEEPPPGRYIDELVSTICVEVDEQIREQVQTFLRRALGQALLRSHGTLIAVTSKAKKPKSLDDGIDLTPALDFAKTVKGVIAKDLDLSELRSQMALIEGMVNSDGIVAFNPLGVLLSYNCFIASPKKVTSKVSGGARRRAYQSLCEKIGRGLSAVYMQSQDGSADFRKEKL